jgi:hypothetical protein
VQSRNGASILVDVTPAQSAGAYAAPKIGHAALIRGDYKNGTLVAKFVLHAKPQAALWGPDR